MRTTYLVPLSDAEHSRLRSFRELHPALKDHCSYPEHDHARASRHWGQNNLRTMCASFGTDMYSGAGSPRRCAPIAPRPA